jgi:hypothetical protein
MNIFDVTTPPAPGLLVDGLLGLSFFPVRARVRVCGSVGGLVFDVETHDVGQVIGLRHF